MGPKPLSDMTYKHFLSLYKLYFNFLDGVLSHTIIFLVLWNSICLFFFFLTVWAFGVISKRALPTQGRSWRFSPVCLTPWVDLVLTCRYLTWFQFICVWWEEKGPASALACGYRAALVQCVCWKGYSFSHLNGLSAESRLTMDTRAHHWPSVLFHRPNTCWHVRATHVISTGLWEASQPGSVSLPTVLSVSLFLSPLNFCVNFRTSLLIMHERGPTLQEWCWPCRSGWGGGAGELSILTAHHLPAHQMVGGGFHWSGAYPVAFSNVE